MLGGSQQEQQGTSTLPAGAAGWRRPRRGERVASAAARRCQPRGVCHEQQQGHSASPQRADHEQLTTCSHCSVAGPASSRSARRPNGLLFHCCRVPAGRARGGGEDHRQGLWLRGGGDPLHPQVRARRPRRGWGGRPAAALCWRSRLRPPNAHCFGTMPHALWSPHRGGRAPLPLTCWVVHPAPCAGPSACWR